MWKPGGRRFFYEGSVLARGLTVFLACSPRGQPWSVLGYKVRGDMSLLGAVGRVQRFAGASTGPTRPANCGFLTTKGRVVIPGVWARRGVQCCGKPTRYRGTPGMYPSTLSRGPGGGLSLSLRAPGRSRGGLQTENEARGRPCQRSHRSRPAGGPSGFWVGPGRC